MSARVLVTGAGGFAGSHLVELLSSRGPVTAWTRSAVDLLDRDAVRSAIADLKPTHVYHCAGSPHVAASWQDTATPYQANVMGTHHLLDALAAEGCSAKVLITGSATVYAPSDAPLTESSAIGPVSPYALSKLAQEQLALRAAADDGLDVIVTRSFNHTGPRQAPSFVAPGIAKQIAEIERGESEPVIQVGNLEAQRDLLDVRDVARAYAALMESGATGTVYNVASGVERSIRSVLDALVARARVAVRIQVDPSRMRPNDIPVLVGDASRLQAATQWRPTVPFEQTMDDLLDYWRHVKA